MLSIRHALELPELLAGCPELVAGASAIDQRIRWVHILESATSIEFLSGGELVLTTGLGWPVAPDFGQYVRSLKSAGIVGLVLELGTRFREVPMSLIKVCDHLEVPLIVLSRRLKFVAVTEAIHRTLLSEQMNVLRARDAVSARFRELMSIGAPAAHIIEETAQVLGVTVVLEDLAHRVITYTRGPNSCLKFLESWCVDSRLSNNAPDDVRSTAYIQARGQKWGRLTVLGRSGHLAGTDFVLSQAVTALSMEMLSQKHSDHWLGLAQRRLLEMLLERKFSTWIECEYELRSAGFEFSGRPVLGLAVQLPARGNADNEELLNSRLQLLRGLATDAGADILAAVHPTTPTILVAVLSLKSSTSNPEKELQKIIKQYRTEAHESMRIAAGTVGTDAKALLDSLREAIQLIFLNQSADGPEQLLLPHTQKLPLLLQSVLSEPTVQGFPERILGPLLFHDAVHGTDLLQVLEAYLQHPTNRTLAATQSRLSRSVFYQRLALIEKLLDRRLDDGQVIATLYVAVLLHRQLHPGTA